MSKSIKVYNIYAKDKCLYRAIKEEEFSSTWDMLNHMIGILQTEYHVEDLHYEEQITTD